MNDQAGKCPIPGLDSFFDNTHQITVLTGAGLSAASGIPTFRGAEGYWTIRSKVYVPQEMATLAMFHKHPLEVWEWYLYRLGVCLAANPNPGHLALARMEASLGDRFKLITQNIDNLHLRAGNSPDRTYQIHGNINYTRCSRPCENELRKLPAELLRQRTMGDLEPAELRLLHCKACGAWLRPHVLWFDESYDEHFFRFESSIAVANRTDLLIIAGTSGATTLPNHLAAIVHRRGKPILDINPDENPFTELARTSRGGAWLQGTAETILPALTVEYCRSISGGHPTKQSIC